MTQGETAGGSFRDPSGFIFERDGVLMRQVNDVYGRDYDQLMESGLYQALVADGLLVAHEEADVALASRPGAIKVLVPERIPFVSYPYEWCFSELKDAALATLEIQERALDHRMSLRDASAYNIQFKDGRAVLIDTLSFERLQEGRPWVAYRQFCQHFLAPLALMCFRDVRLGRLAALHIDGVPLDLAAAVLPRRAWLRPALALHVRAHASAQQRHAGKATGGQAQREFSLRAFRGLIDSLKSGVAGLAWEPDRSQWLDYYDQGDSYTAEALEHKTRIVTAYLDEVRPDTVWDLGANTGRFARIAAGRGASTVAFDADAAPIEAAYRQLRADGERGLLPLVVDLTNPTPALGWAGKERLSLAERGPAATGLALALVHHLAIGNNVPLQELAATLRELCRSLIVEFVPKSDPKVQLLLASREDVFADYHRNGFEAAFSASFDIARRDEVRDSERTLYLMRGR